MSTLRNRLFRRLHDRAEDAFAVLLRAIASAPTTSWTSSTSWFWPTAATPTQSPAAVRAHRRRVDAAVETCLAAHTLATSMLTPQHWTRPSAASEHRPLLLDIIERHRRLSLACRRRRRSANSDEDATLMPVAWVGALVSATRSPTAVEHESTLTFDGEQPRKSSIHLLGEGTLELVDDLVGRFVVDAGDVGGGGDGDDDDEENVDGDADGVSAARARAREALGMTADDDAADSYASFYKRLALRLVRRDSMILQALGRQTKHRHHLALARVLAEVPSTPAPSTTLISSADEDVWFFVERIVAKTLAEDILDVYV